VASVTIREDEEEGKGEEHLDIRSEAVPEIRRQSRKNDVVHGLF